MFGNILIVIVFIFYGCLIHLSLKPMPGGDYGVGYAFAWLIYVAGFIISTGLLALTMNINHCFDWAPNSILRYRHWLVFIGWIALLVAILWSFASHSKQVEDTFPTLIRWFIWSKVHIWLPLLILITSLYLVNAQRMTGFAPHWVKISMLTGLTVSFLMVLGIFWTFGKSWLQRQAERSQMGNFWQTERQSSYEASLEHITNYKEATIAGLLKFAHPENDKRQRNAAIAKIKSFENWENDLIDILAQKNLHEVYVYDDNTYFVYAFLDGNKIEHPEKFIQPILSSLKVLSIRVKKSLEDPYSLELGRSDIEIVCRVLEAQFKEWAAEFRPSITKLQEALDITPPERKNKEQKKSYIRTLKAYRLAVKNWLESNQ